MICVNQVSSQSHNQCYDAREHTSKLTHESPCSKSDHKAQWEQRVVLPINGHHNFPHQNLKQAEGQADEQSRTEPEMEELHEEFGDIFRNTARIAERRRKVRACVRKELCRFQKPQSSESQDTPEPKGHCEKRAVRIYFPLPVSILIIYFSTPSLRLAENGTDNDGDRPDPGEDTDPGMTLCSERPDNSASRM